MNNKLSLYILTDTHYLSEKMWEECEHINNREMGDQIAIKSTPYILRSFFKKIIEDKETEYVLITGDLINNGDKVSHLDFIKELKMLTDAGKKVFVTGATHDYAGLGDDENFFKPVRYTKDGCVEAERVYKTELPSLYYDFGHKYADSIDEESGSYSVGFSGGFRLIAIYDNGNGRSHCGLFDKGFNWLENEIKKANEKGEWVFLAVHHPVLPPWPIYREIADFELFGGYERLRKIMCESSVNVVFTGHTHVHGIKKYEDKQGRFFYDVTTSALPSAEGRMRKAVFDKNEGTCEISSFSIDEIEGWDTNGLSARDYIYSLNFVGLIEKSFPLIDTDWEKFVDNMSHVFNIPFVKEHPLISKRIIKLFLKLKISFAARVGGKACGLTKKEKCYLKNMSLSEVVFNVIGKVFAGNGPYPPDTPEYKAITGGLSRLMKIFRIFGFDADKLIPGEESVLETLCHFLYNDRTGDDDSITIKMEK